MRFIWLILLGTALVNAGCAHHKTKPKPKPTPTPPAADAAYAPLPGTPGAAPTTPAAKPAQPAPEPTAAAAPPAVQSPAPAQTDAGVAPTPPVTATPTPAAPKIGQEKLIVTPETSVVGKVAKVNEVARFVIVSYPIGRVPPVDKQLNVYRRGLKVGEVKVTVPQQDELTAADIVAGEAAEGDEVR